jgi:hypothetical protein
MIPFWFSGKEVNKLLKNNNNYSWNEKYSLNQSFNLKYLSDWTVYVSLWVSKNLINSHGKFQAGKKLISVNRGHSMKLKWSSDLNSNRKLLVTFLGAKTVLQL